MPYDENTQQEPLTQEIIRLMPVDEYQRKSADPQFRAAVDKLFATKGPKQ